MRAAAAWAGAALIVALFASISAMGSVAASGQQPLGGDCTPGNLPGGTFSQADIAKLWVTAGGPSRDVNGDGVPEDLTAGAVGMAESGGNPNIQGVVIPATGKRASGLMQIHPPEPGWQDPQRNMRMALRKFRAAGNTWKPWEAYTGPDGQGSDGPWRQFLGRTQETSAITCAVGTLGPGNLDELLEANRPGIIMSPGQRQDLLAGGIDPRLIATLTYIRDTLHLTGIVTALRRDHSPGTNHEAGRAADLDMINGQDCNGSRTNPCGQLAVKLAQLPPQDRPTELIYCFDADGPGSYAFARPDHCDHLHVGFDG